MSLLEVCTEYEKVANEEHKPEHLEYRGHTIKVFYEDGDWIAEIAKIGDKEGRMPQFGLQKEVAIKRAKEAIDKMCSPRDKIATKKHKQEHRSIDWQSISDKNSLPPAPGWVLDARYVAGRDDWYIKTDTGWYWLHGKIWKQVPNGPL